MQLHTTNTINTFIEVSEDCPAMAGTVPKESRRGPTAASWQYGLIAEHPYEWTSDDVQFLTHMMKIGDPCSVVPEMRIRFFSHGQPCMRASALGKRYGWGVHSDAQGRIAIYGVESEEYRRLAADPEVMHVKAMRNRRR